MNSLNEVTIQGNFAKDPVVHENELGKITYFDIACTNSFKNKKEEKVENTVWVSVQAKNGLADVVAKYFKKGSRAVLSGNLKNTTKEIDGKNYTFTTLNLQKIFQS
jgi:single-strand DNA-binding protein